MYPSAIGERAAHLTWLWPDAASMLQLARPWSAVGWDTVRDDPAALAALYRNADEVPRSPLCSGHSTDPAFWDGFFQASQTPADDWVDWRHPCTLAVYDHALAVAHLAHHIAAVTRRCDPETAWVGGMLAPLGWFAVAAVDISAILACVTDPAYGEHALRAQVRHWGIDHRTIADRLAQAWRLPRWLGVIVSGLHLPPGLAKERGADPDLFAVVQAAAHLAERWGRHLELVSGVRGEDVLDELNIPSSVLADWEERYRNLDLSRSTQREWVDPRTLSRWPTMLHAARDRSQARVSMFPTPTRLVSVDVDANDRLRTAKLTAVAEFAAGAGHEINNPLAVISGQSQYLLKSEADAGRRESLQSIVRQTARIHALLTEMMHFARPPQLEREELAVAEVLQAVLEEMQEFADAAGVKLDCTESADGLLVEADPRLLPTALCCLVRNAIEAAGPNQGRVRIAAESVLPGRLDFIVEDTGPGPSPAVREHMFDPFYSGRTAGRGHGMGLPAAWRLAHEHGGDVKYVPLVGGPTRFVFSMPMVGQTHRLPERMTA